MSRRSRLVLVPLLGAAGAGCAIAVALLSTHRGAPLPMPEVEDLPDRFVELIIASDDNEEPTVWQEESAGTRSNKQPGGTEDPSALLSLLAAETPAEQQLAPALDSAGGLIGTKGTGVGGGGSGSAGSGLGSANHSHSGSIGMASGSVASGSVAYGSAASPQAAPALDVMARPRRSTDGTEDFKDYGVNELTLVKDDNLSTFSIDVDTGSYTLARSSLNGGSLPSASSVRVEEFLNYFDYDYVGPTGAAPFAVNMEAAPSPWLANHHVLRVGVQGDRLDATERKPVRLVFLVDVSGSMSGSGRLDLAKQSLTYLVDQLGPEDSVGLVTYAGSVKRVLEPTAVTQKGQIKAAIAGLHSGGSTAMGSGLDWAYDMANTSFVRGAENRVIVLSDGDANVGKTSHEQMLTAIRDHAAHGITLSTVGFGRGNYKDTMMEQLADEGDGNYGYVDSLDEGRRLFGERLSGTVQTIARDVKIQVEFNPKAVIGYRLIGYENRDIVDTDFRNDHVDAGEIGSGHSVTALYDVVLKDGWASNELATVRLRAKPPGADAPADEWLTTFQPRMLQRKLSDGSRSFRLALGAATFAELMRGSPYVEETTYGQVWELVHGAQRASQEEDAELLTLIEKAARLTGQDSFLAAR